MRSKIQNLVRVGWKKDDEVYESWLEKNKFGEDREDA